MCYRHFLRVSFVYFRSLFCHLGVQQMIAEMSPGRRPPPPLYNTLLTGTPSAAFEDSDEDSASVNSYTKYSGRSNPPPPYPKAPTVAHSTSALNTNSNSPFRMPSFPSTTTTTTTGNNTSTSTAIVKRSPFIQQSSGSVIGGSPRIGTLSGRNSSAPVKLPIPVKLFEASFL